MPLVNFKTNLTSLKFGMDQPGGGDSGQPFIQSPIETPNTPTEFRDFYNLNRTSLDFPIRGGAISSLVNGSYTTQAALVDAERIKKFFQSAPRGTAFIQKQTGLQLTNPRTQVPNSLQFVGLSLDNVVIPVTQTYNPANTLAQVAVQGNGAHFNRHGVSPTIYESIYQTYQYIAGNPENNTEATNRLSILRALKLIGTTDFIVNPLLVGGTGIDPTLVDRLGISTIQNQLFNYQGGPGSNYGIGFTRIFRATNTDITRTADSVGFTVKGVNQPYSAIALTYRQLAEQGTRDTNPLSPVQAKIQDFRSQTNLGRPIIPHSNYGLNNLNTKYNIGNPGAPNSRVNYTDTRSVGSDVGVDKLNLLNPFFFNPNETDPWAVAKEDSNDMIRFAFECIDNNNPAFTVALIFRAFLEGQIADSNTAEFNAFKYLGRGETFRTYQGFDRSISFSFKMFAQSRQEMQPMYKKLNQLVSQVYPDYSSTYNLMRGNVVNLTIGDYLYRTPGFIENINITIDNSNTPWEIALNEYPEDDVRQLPHMVTVQCNFKPIMNILPRKETANTPNAVNSFVPLLANRDHYLDPNADTVGKQKSLLVTSDQNPLTPIQGPIVATPGSGVGAQAVGITEQPVFTPLGNQTSNSVFNPARNNNLFM